MGEQIKELHQTHPAYGHRRVALALQCSPGKAIRVMRKFGIKPPRRKIRIKYLTKSVEHHSYTNLIKEIKPTRPLQVFCSDLTYIRHQGKFVYLATVEDIFTREIVAADMSNKHDSQLAFSVAQKSTLLGHPDIFHTDQGSEFMATKVTSYLEHMGIAVSVSAKGSPWQNGYKESFFDKFKTEIGDLGRFEDLGELVAEVYAYIDYHNKYRIHTKLKMPPLQFKQNFLESLSQNSGT